MKTGNKITSLVLVLLLMATLSTSAIAENSATETTAVIFSMAAPIANAEPAITVSSVAGRVGEKVSVDVAIENSPGIKMFQLGLCYDNSKLKFDSYSGNRDLYATGYHIRSDDPLPVNETIYEVQITYTGDLNKSITEAGDMLLCTFVFEIRAGATGEVPLTLGQENSYVIDDLSDCIFAEIKNGKVTVLTGSASANVSGKVKSYKPSNPTTIQLIKGEKVYTTTISGTSGSGQMEQEFTFAGVEPGIYELIITKAVHTKFTVRNVVVGEQDVDLTKDIRSEVQVMTLLCGDISGDGEINQDDINVLWQPANYNRRVTDGVNPNCDLNGDGEVNQDDVNILWQPMNYNKGAVVVQ
ncbi:MAG: hypothetical protein FWD21_02205 [Peptococcaceae bacterium]|nr:hypothetical protein [Peptococcaceae bacterium]